VIYKLTDSFAQKIKWLVVLLFMKLFCTLFAVIIFSKFTPLVDANMYLMGKYPTSTDSLRTITVQIIAVATSKLGGTIFAHWIFGFFSTMGLIYYLIRGGNRWQMALFLFLPSALIWTSVVGKEAIFYGAFTLVLVIWERFVANKLTFEDKIFLTLGTVVCMFFRPHYGQVIFWLIVSTFLVKRYGLKSWLLLSLLASLYLCLLFTFAWDNLLARGLGGIDLSGRASRFILFGIDPETGAGFERYKSLLPLGTILGIIGPMPTELLSRPEFIPFFLEGVLILLFPAGVYVYAMKQSFEGKRQFQQIFWMCLVPAILALMLFHTPFGLLNPGTASRWRVNFEAAFLMAPILLLGAFIDDK